MNGHDARQDDAGFDKTGFDTTAETRTVRTLDRRQALARLGLGAAAIYLAPTVTSLDEARAAFPSGCSGGGRPSRGGGAPSNGGGC